MKRRILITSLLALVFCGGTFAANDAAKFFDGIRLTDSYKKLSNHNPLFTQRFGADPFAMIYNDEVFIYMTNDVLEYQNGTLIENSYSKINTINCVSSKDMVNWTDHGTMGVAGRNNNSYPAKWATCSWAPTACHKTVDGKEKFFLYFANNGSGIGVVTSDCPWGPWVDPIGKELVSRNTPNCGNVTWLFDPAVLVDDDGTGYIYFGGGVPQGQDANPGTARVAKLGRDFISIDGQAKTINPPYLFEDAGINKIAGKYIYSYCSNWNTGGNRYGFKNAEICYMTSNDPMGPFEYTGIAYENQGGFFNSNIYGDNGGNNHHAMFEFKGKWYMTYHARLLQNAMGICPGKNQNYRSTHVDYVNVNTVTGSITKSKGSAEGVAQVGSLNPFERTEAETIAWMAGIDTRYGGSNMIVTDIDKGDWIGVAGVDFGEGASLFSAYISANKEGAIKICKGKPDGDVIGYLPIPSTGGNFKEISAKLDVPISGKNDIFFIFSGDFEFDYWQFKESDVVLTASESIVSAPATISFEAKTSEAGIQKADLYLEGTLIGSSEKAPYTFEYEIEQPGTYNFQAVLTDGSGKTYETNIESVKARGPYEGIAQTIPGRLEVERYDVGGEGFAYQDESSVFESTKCTFRNDEGVDLDVTEEGDYVLGWTKKGEWLEYTINVDYDDTYNWVALVASGLDGSGFRLYIDGEAITEAIEVPNTDSWTNYASIKGKTSKLTAGKHTLRLSIEADYCNIDYIEFTAENHETSNVTETLADTPCQFNVYSLQGILLETVESTAEGMSNTLKEKNYANGTYIIKSQCNNFSQIILVK